MKTNYRGWASVLVVGLVSGCSTTGIQQAERTALSLAATQTEVKAASQQVAATMQVVDQLAGASGTDLRPLHAQLGQNLRAVEQQADRAANRADQYQRNAQAYVDAWATEISTIQSSSIRHASAERRAHAVSNFRSISDAAAAAREAYEPFVVDVQGIVQSLGLDLTAGGVEAVKPFVEKARGDAQTLQAAINALLVELDRVKLELSPTSAEPGGV